MSKIPSGLRKDSLGGRKSGDEDDDEVVDVGDIWYHHHRVLLAFVFAL
jgi:hypothetical protein